jgi:hypothetical protein
MLNSRVRPLDGFSSEYDVVIAALGYERRSRFVCESLAPRAMVRACCGFSTDHVLSFAENKRWFEDAGFHVEIHDNIGFMKWLDEVLRRSLTLGKHRIRVLVDISSQTRFRIAAVLNAIASCTANVEVDVEFAYALAAFSAPPAEASVIATAGPVLDRFAGWSAQLELPVSVVVGAGYEPDKVLGVLEYLEPGAVWVWVPHGKDGRFLDAIKNANQSLWEHVSEERRINYSVMCPYETFVRLESLCYGLMRWSRPVLVPFGPKIFALTAMLVALHWPDELSVWRVSGEQSETPVDCHAEGTLSGLKVEFRAAGESAEAGGRMGKTSSVVIQ